MATKQIVTHTDDTDGSAADEVVTFSLDGVGYEIDLSADNARQLREALAPWMAVGRRLARNGQPYRRIDLDAETSSRRRRGRARSRR